MVNISSFFIGFGLMIFLGNLLLFSGFMLFIKEEAHNLYLGMLRL
jgi:hypothetical protein